ncbi:MAG TPA: DoxX family protein [Candidatus Melainabacteria bacterium]|jgi:putative oxidoreductase|nr:DoxX family protein [Candidatus Melainabacteria bacterium]HIN66436.1 DoxX family protein [Candidatus Obscuribacterales bacterium]
MDKYTSLLALYARFLLSMSMFWAAFFNVAGWNDQLTMLYPVAMNLSAPLLAATTAAEIVLGISIFIGYATKYMAWMCIFYTMVMACVTHQFWGVEPGLQAREAMNFLQAFGSAGGFLLLIALGPGKFSVDQLLKEPVSPTPTPAAETKS